MRQGRAGQHRWLRGRPERLAIYGTVHLRPGESDSHRFQPEKMGIQEFGVVFVDFFFLINGGRSTVHGAIPRAYFQEGPASLEKEALLLPGVSEKRGFWPSRRMDV